MKKTMWAMLAVIIVLFGVVAWGFMEYVYEPRESIDLTEEIDEEDDSNLKPDDNEEEVEDEFDAEAVENKNKILRQKLRKISRIPQLHIPLQTTKPNSATYNLLQITQRKSKHQRTQYPTIKNHPRINPNFTLIYKLYIAINL